MLIACSFHIHYRDRRWILPHHYRLISKHSFKHCESMTDPLICPADQVIESGKGVRFNIGMAGKPRPAFVIRFNGTAHAYFNWCPHLGTELDWQHGEFFDVSGLYLICATHGAMFLPDSGYCVAGPCKGQRLARLPLVERNGEIFLGEGFTLYDK